MASWAQQKGDPFKTIKPIPEVFELLPFNSVRPSGWLKENLQQNLNGFTGHLDKLASDLLEKDDIYGRNRLSRNAKSKNVGAISDGGEFQAQFLWWNSETQSNWLDGFIRTAILLNDSVHLGKAESIVKRLLATQDADGYLGIYDKDLRYRFENENGELWSKATLYRGLLAWYEYKSDKAILTAIEKAVANVLKNYPINESHPFHSTNPDAGGATHGLAFTDVLERLYQLTGNQAYRDYCLFLYADFSKQILNEDAQLKKLLEQALPLKGHGVHTYEHLRSVAAAYYASGNPEIKLALDNFLTKIDKATVPSGAPIGDEWVGGKTADATQTGYEYCSLHELMDGWADLLRKSGDRKYGDKAEHLFFNAAMGATHPSESAICYLKTDNSYSLSGGKHGDTSDKYQTRYRYSPVHKEAAVCCVPNAGKITPYYIQNMWLKGKGSLVASLLGPCEVTTMINGSPATITEATKYPFKNHLTFTISTDKPNRFTIKVRKPEWATSVKASPQAREENGFLVFTNTWKNKDSITISFQSEIKIRETANQEVYFVDGPLVLCHPIEGAQLITKTYSVEGLRESTYSSGQNILYQYNRSEVSKSTTEPTEYKTTMLNAGTQTQEAIKLVPMFHTILRQVTFKK